MRAEVPVNTGQSRHKMVGFERRKHTQVIFIRHNLKATFLFISDLPNTTVKL
jgi:hypothetical protein